MIRDWDASYLYSPEIRGYAANIKFDILEMTVRDSYVKLITKQFYSHKEYPTAIFK